LSVTPKHLCSFISLTIARSDYMTLNWARDYFALLVLALLLLPIPPLAALVWHRRRNWPGIPCVLAPRFEWLALVLFIALVLALAALTYGLFLAIYMVQSHLSMFEGIALIFAVGGLASLLFALKETDRIALNARAWICKAEFGRLDIMTDQKVYEFSLQPGSVKVTKILHGPGGVLTFDYAIEVSNSRVCLALPWSYYWNLDIQYTDTARHSQGLLVRSTNSRIQGLHRYLQQFVAA
jgi:hypothetical protein